MKSSASGDDHPRPDVCVIVDGYNVIGRKGGPARGQAWPDWESARAWLLAACAAYLAYTGEDVVIVYDATQPGRRESEEKSAGVRILYTGRQETADQRIERLVSDLRKQYRQVIVATSDAAVQQMTFGAGALRIPAGEWLDRLAATEQEIRRAVERRNETENLQKGRLADRIRQDVGNILEKWRRE